ncbi:hypothetical protein [Pseudomonas oryzihabitans]|uniref:hypothetical protein n=1 Tax=Pseudomonas oryzihabitans TaxID=47885 RepID=UPI002895E2D7|nr:hypothetical protein [Pseudomonas oryzihabitans]MDT3723202.1 hypothetical protein [Pseudomonas oryzihabitans]
MEQGIDRLRTALAPYTTTAAPRPADRAMVVTVSYGAAEVTRAVKLADLEDQAKLADVINDFKRDMAAGREGGEEEHAKLTRRLGSRGLESFNPELRAPHKAK